MRGAPPELSAGDTDAACIQSAESPRNPDTDPEREPEREQLSAARVSIRWAETGQAGRARCRRTAVRVLLSCSCDDRRPDTLLTLKWWRYVGLGVPACREDSDVRIGVDPERQDVPVNLVVGPVLRSRRGKPIQSVASCGVAIERSVVIRSDGVVGADRTPVAGSSLRQPPRSPLILNQGAISEGAGPAIHSSEGVRRSIA